MIIHHFLVEFGTSGEIYDVGCIGDKDELLKYWYNVSRDVRYKCKRDTERNADGSLKNKPKAIKSQRKLGNAGYAVSCKFYCDFPQSIPRSKRFKIFDERYKLIIDN